MKPQQQNLASLAGGFGSSPGRSYDPAGAGFSVEVGMDNLGWIKTFRKMRDWEWYGSGNTFRVFVELLLTANYEDSRFMGVEIKRGQCVCGRDSIAKTLGISPQSVRSAIARLKSTNEITIKSTNKFSIVTICNWDIYQGQQNEINHQNSQQINKPSTSNQPAINHIQEVKKVRSKEEDNAASAADLSLTGEVEAPSEYRNFIELWECAFFDYWKANYVFQGVKDGQAVKRLLKVNEVTPRQLVDLARKAWQAGDKKFNCKMAGTIAGFASRINEIRIEVTPKPSLI